MSSITIGDVKTKFKITFQSIFQDYCRYILNIERDKKWANFFLESDYINLYKKIKYWNTQYGDALSGFINIKGYKQQEDQEPRSNEAEIQQALEQLKSLNEEKDKLIKQFNIPEDVILADDGKWRCSEASKKDAKNMYNMKIEGSLLTGGVFDPKVVLTLNTKLDQDYVLDTKHDVIFSKADIPWLITQLLNINHFIKQTKYITPEYRDYIADTIKAVHIKTCDKLPLLNHADSSKDNLKPIVTNICSDFLWKSLKSQIGIMTSNYIKVTENINRLNSILSSEHNSTAIVILSGAPGMGKTTCAEEYVRENYTNHVIWKFQADDLENSLISFANYIGIVQEIKNRKDYFKLGLQIKARLKYLSSHIKFGMVAIFDNAKQSSMLTICLWSLESAIRIVTTRDANLIMYKLSHDKEDDLNVNKLLNNYNKDVEQMTLKYISISPFTTDDAIKYISQRFADSSRKNDSNQEVQNLIAKVGLTPHLLKIATSYLVENPTKTMSQYINSFDSKKKDSILITSLESLNKETLKIAVTLAKLHPDCLEEDFLIDRLFGEESEDRLEKLAKLSVIAPIRKDTVCVGYEMHREMQRVLKEHFKSDQDEEILQSLINALVETVDVEYTKDTDLEYSKIYIKHSEKVLTEAENSNLNKYDFLKLYSKLGEFYNNLGQYSTELEYQLKILQARQEFLSENHPDLALSYNNVGVTYGDLGDYNKDLEFKLKALEISKEVLPENHPDLASNYNNVGSTYGELGDHNKALEFKLKALEIREEVLPENHPDLALSYNNVGSTYDELGDHNKALEFKLKALEISKEVLPENHPDLALSYNNVGSTYGELGDHNKASEFKLKALEIREEVLPKNHPNLATSYNNVGTTYGKFGDYNKALKFELKALEISKEVLPKNHPDLAKSYNNVGSTYGDLGDHNKALEFKLKALEIRKEVLPKNHPNLALSHNNIGVTYSKLGDYNKALEFKLKALEIWKEVLPKNHPNLASSYNNVGFTYGNLGDHNKALEFQLKALEIREEVLPKNHPNLATSYNNVGFTYVYLGDHDKALEFQLKTLEISKGVLPKNLPNLASSYNNVGFTYGNLGDHNKALEFKLKALEIRKEVLPKNHPNLALSYNNVGSTYVYLGDHNKALKFQLKALEIWKERLPENHPDLAQSYNNVGVTYYYLNDNDNAIKYIKCAYKICSTSQYCDTSSYIKSINILEPQCDSVCLKQSICVVSKLQHDINDIGKEEL